MSYGPALSTVTDSYRDDPELRRRIEQMRAEQARLEGGNPSNQATQGGWLDAIVGALGWNDQSRRKWAWPFIPAGVATRNIVEGLPAAAHSIATLPRDVYEGKVDPMSDEGIARSAETAMSLVGGPKGSIGAGNRRMAAARRVLSAEDIAAAAERAQSRQPTQQAAPSGPARVNRQPDPVEAESGFWPEGSIYPKQPPGTNVPVQGPPQRFGEAPAARIQPNESDLERIRRFVASMPAIQTRGDDPLVERIITSKKERGFKPHETAQQPVFDVNPQTYADTTQITPQSDASWRDVPRPDPGDKLPKGGRSQQFIDYKEQIAQKLADDLKPHIQSGAEFLNFYHTGPVTGGFMNRGMSPTEANQFMGDWSGQGAATSPRTATPQNLSNATLLKLAQDYGNPYTTARHGQEGTIPGYPMMGMHTTLGEQFWNDRVNSQQNPKPFMFREHWRGNLPGITADTHAIRASLAALDSVHPGGLHPGWFKGGEQGKYYKAYKERGHLPTILEEAGLDDSLGSVARNKVKRQTEYGVVADPMERAGEILGLPGSTVQAGTWFGQGARTGLVSPPKTIPNLLNDQIEGTARATGLHPEQILRLWMGKRIPLAEGEDRSGTRTG